MKKTKKFAAFAISISICSLCSGGFSAIAADDLSVGDIGWITSDDTETPETSGICGEKAVWEFDDEMGTLTISGEGEVAFEGSAPWYDLDLHRNIKKAVIEEGITVLPEYTFDFCTKLETIELPSTVKSIDPNAWILCVGLREIFISPDNETFSAVDGVLFSKDMTTLIKYPAGNKNEKYVIPDSVTTLDFMAFTFCRNLTDIVIPESVNYINENFEYCTSLSEVLLPESLEYINGLSFLRTPWLSAKQEETPFVMINDILFNGSACVGDIVIPDEANTIADYAFSFNENITSVTFNDKIKNVSVASFDSCSALTDVIFSDSIVSIDSGAFVDTAIESIEIPENISFIGWDAFCNCENLSQITILNPECEIYDSASTISNRNYLNNTSFNGYDGTIRGYKGSTAEAYAEKYGYNFEALEVSLDVAGDANGDGELTIADVVLLQQWLLGSADSIYSQNVDLCKDGVIDVYDLCLLRKEIISYFSAD